LTPPAGDRNSLRAESDWPSVVVAGGHQTGVLLTRHLSKRGVKVFCVEWYRKQACFRTVYGTTLECPNPDEKLSEWLSFMAALGAKLNHPVLIPIADQFVTVIAQNAEELAANFRFYKDATALQTQLCTKQQQYRIAEEHGFPSPKTRFVKSLEEVREFAENARFPCVVKPLYSRDWGQLSPGHPLYALKVAMANSPEDLAAKYRVAAEIKPELVVQEIIEGPDSNKLVYLSCYSGASERIGTCMVRELRTFPITNGSASIVEPESDPDVDAMCDRFLRGLHYVGLCEIELKRDTRDGQVKLIEVNPRYSGTADSAVYAGVELGWLHYLDVIGRPVIMTHPNGRDFRHILLAADLATIRSYRRAGLLSWKELLRSYRPPLAFYDFDLRDWRLAIQTLMNIVRVLIGPPLRRLFPKRRPGGS
jgi:predicted ATP-grasp superfamily ATP-dependent carboligase